MSQVSFAQLNDGKWGLRAPLRSLTQGEEVAVQKRNGEVSHVIVGAWVSDDRGAFQMNGPKGASYYRIARTAPKRNAFWNNDA